MAFGRVIKIEENVKYKIKPGFELREVVGRSVVVYVGNDEEFNGIIRLNEAGVSVWKQLIDGADVDSIIVALEEEYDAEHQVIAADVNNVLVSLLKENVIEKC